MIEVRNVITLVYSIAQVLRVVPDEEKVFLTLLQTASESSAESTDLKLVTPVIQKLNCSTVFFDRVILREGVPHQH